MEIAVWVVLGIGALVVGVPLVLIGTGFAVIAVQWILENWRASIVLIFALIGSFASEMIERIAAVLFGIGLAVIASLAVLVWKSIAPHAARWLSKWNELTRPQRVTLLAVLMFLTPLAWGVYSLVQELGDQRGPWEKYRTPAQSTQVQQFDWNQFETVKPPVSTPIRPAHGKPDLDSFETHTDYVLALTEWNLKTTARGSGRNSAKADPSTKKPISDNFETLAEYVEALSTWKVKQALFQNTRIARTARPASIMRPNPDSFDTHVAYIEALIDWKIVQVLSRQSRKTAGSNP